MNQEQWPRLESWLHVFPDKLIAQSSALLLMKAWVFQKRLRLFEIPALLDSVEPLLAALPPESANTEHLYGELAALRSYQYFIAADSQQVVRLARQALEGLPEKFLYARSGAIVMQGMGHQMSGDFTRATTTVYQALQDEAFHHTASHIRLLVALCFIYWIEADLPGFHQAATQHLKLSQNVNLPESFAMAHYFLGIFHYQRNDLAAAEHILTEAVNTSPSFNSINFGFSTFALALTYQAREKPEDACEAADTIVALAMETGNTTLLGFAQAFQAELAL
jgi:ATP/maltotriose-dependent transcriptional regulator MalT